MYQAKKVVPNTPWLHPSMLCTFTVFGPFNINNLVRFTVMLSISLQQNLRSGALIKQFWGNE